PSSAPQTFAFGNEVTMRNRRGKQGCCHKLLPPCLLDTGHGTQDTGHGTRDMGHGTRKTENGTRNTEHGTRNTEHGTRNTEHGTRNTEPPDPGYDGDTSVCFLTCYEEAERRRKGKMVVSDFLSGTGISKIEAENMRERGLSFLKKQLKSKPTEDNGWSDLLGSSEALFRNGIEMDNSETSIRIHPFYIEKGGNHIEAKGFKFLASTTCRNSMRVLRAM
ncbi:hypothetical protein Tco_0600751, partial [Tanacetum coccineum]